MPPLNSLLLLSLFVCHHRHCLRLCFPERKPLKQQSTDSVGFNTEKSIFFLKHIRVVDTLHHITIAVSFNVLENYEYSEHS